MTTRRVYNPSFEYLSLPVDFIDLTNESPICSPSQTSSSSTIRSVRPRKLKKSVSIKAVSGMLDAAVTSVTSVIPITSSSTSSGTRNAARSDTRSRTRNAARSDTRSRTRNAARSVSRSNAGVRAMITASDKSRNASNNQCKNETINLDDTILPGHSGPWHTDDSTTLFCPICLEKLLSQCKPTATRCGHIFCEECLNRVMDKTKTCPQCRTNITKKSCIRLHF